MPASIHSQANAEGNDARPCAFISSTVLDFGDLRSSLAFWLEEIGYKVILSERSDNPIESSLGTIENCLQLVRTSSLYILLVGKRRGFYCDESQHLTVTRAEYREAYNLARSGRMRIAIFIRSDVERAIREGNPSEFQDFDFTRDFVGEIRRTSEMTEASAHGGPFPLANWTVSFSSFRDIVSSLQATLHLGEKLRKRALRANLRWELATNLTELLNKHKGEISFEARYLVSLQKQLDLRLENGFGVVKLTVEQAKLFAWAGVSVVLARTNRLSVSALNEAVNSGEFLEYIKEKDEFIVGTVQSVMLRLRNDIAFFIQAASSHDGGALLEKLSRVHTMNSPAISTVDLATVLQAANYCHNVTSISLGMIAYLDGNNPGLRAFELAPETPFRDSALSLADGRVTFEDIDKYLRVFYGGLP